MFRLALELAANVWQPTNKKEEKREERGKRKEERGKKREDRSEKKQAEPMFLFIRHCFFAQNLLFFSLFEAERSRVNPLRRDSRMKPPCDMILYEGCLVSKPKD